MGSPFSTLQDALARAKSLGLSATGSLLDQAKAGFDAATELGQNGVKDFASWAAPPTPVNGWGSVAQSLFSANKAFGDSQGNLFGLQGTNDLPGPVRTTLDLGLAPSTLITAGLGPEISAGFGKIPAIGGLLQNLTAPVIGNGAGFATRLAGETAVNVGGQYGGQVGADLTQNAPTPIRIGGAIAGSLAGGIAAGAGVAGVRNIANIRSMAAENAMNINAAGQASNDRKMINAALTAQGVDVNDPTAIAAHLAGTNDTNLLGAVERLTGFQNHATAALIRPLSLDGKITPEQTIALSSMDDTASILRKSALSSTGAGTPPPELPLDAVERLVILKNDAVLGSLNPMIGNEFSQAKYVLGTDATGQIAPLGTEPANLGKMADSYTAATERHPWLKTVVNYTVPSGLRQFAMGIGDGVTRQVGRFAHGFEQIEVHRATQAADYIGSGLANVLGDSFENLPRVLPEAAVSTRVSYQRMIDAKNYAQAWGYIVAHRNEFDLAGIKGLPEAMDQLQVYMGALPSYDKLFNVKYDAADLPYAPQNMGEIRDATGTVVDQPTVAAALGHERGFQQARLFTDPAEAHYHALNGPDDWNAFLQSKIDALNVDKANVSGKTPDDLLAARKRIDDHIAAYQKFIDNGWTLGPATPKSSDPTDQIRAMYGERLVSGARARAEQLALNMASNLSDKQQTDLKTLLAEGQVSKFLTYPSNVAATIRSAVLNGDLSGLGLQAWGSVIMNGGGMNLGNFAKTYSFGTLHTAMSSEKYAMWELQHADALSRAALDGVEFNTNMLELGRFSNDLLEDPWTLGRKGAPVIDTTSNQPLLFAGKPVRSAPTNFNPVEGPIRALNTFQFQRLMTMYKLETHQYATDLLNAAANYGTFKTFLGQVPNNGNPEQRSTFGHLIVGMGKTTPEERAVASANFVNNLYGGLNRVAQGKTVTHNIIESLFMLTPGFTRGTISIGAKAGFRGPEEALSRDFAIRGTALAAGLVTAITAGVNGINGNGLVLPNVTDPTKSDWMDIPLPGGGYIRPLSRFRSPAVLTAKNLDAIVKNPMELATYGGVKDSVLQWLSGRQSSLVSSLAGDPIGALAGPNAGNQYVRGNSLWDVLTNPSTNRLADFRDMLVGNTLPIIGQDVAKAAETGDMFTPAGAKMVATSVGADLFGQQARTPTPSEQKLLDDAGMLALQNGVTPDALAQSLHSMKNPIDAKDANGAYILDQTTRTALTKQVADANGVGPDALRQIGTINQRPRVQDIQIAQQAQLTDYFKGIDAMHTDYAQNRDALEASVMNGTITPKDYSSKLGDLRKIKAGELQALQQQNPYAVSYLSDSSKHPSANEKDKIFSAMSAEYNNQEQKYYDPSTGTFDFNARDALLQSIKAKYPQYFDQWQANMDKNKSQMELVRDQGINTLSPYFDVGDKIWQQATGGKYGASQGAFEQSISQAMTQQGVPLPQIQQYIATIESKTPSIKQAINQATQARKNLRISDPNVDIAAQLWLGLPPLTAQQPSWKFSSANGPNWKFGKPPKDTIGANVSLDMLQ